MKILEEEFDRRRKLRESLSNGEKTDLDLELLKAAANGKQDYTYGCLWRGADPNVRDSDGNTPLILAARKGYEGTVGTLLEGGADPELKNNTDNTALDFAIEGRYRRTIAALMPYQANLTPEKRKLCEEILNAAMWKIPDEEVERRKQLRKKLTAAERSKLDSELLEAATYGHGRDAAACLEKGANVDTRNEAGNTPLMQAAAAGHTATVQILLEAHAKPNLKNKAGKIALVMAIEGGHFRTVLAIRNHQPTLTEAMRQAAVEAGNRAEKLGPLGTDTSRWVKENLAPG